jgi:hypothetical protein
MLPEARLRVGKHTKDHVQDRIREKMRSDIHHYAKAGPTAIDQRLRQLQVEWDIERTLEANAAAFSLAGLVLGKTVHPRFYWLSAGVAGFLLQHALQGWCPPMALFRRLGIRTSEEIEAERSVLQLIRGDFKDAMKSSDVQNWDIDQIIRKAAAGRVA